MLLRQRLVDRPRWNQLRGFGNSVVAKSTIGIPILGYLLIFNNEVVKLLTLHSDFCSGNSCAPSWRLYCFYFGCCLIALGSAVYAVFCPSLIKKYKDAATFFRSDKEFFAEPTSLAHLFDVIEKAKGKPANDPLSLKLQIRRDRKSVV